MQAERQRMWYVNLTPEQREAPAEPFVHREGVDDRCRLRWRRLVVGVQYPLL